MTLNQPYNEKPHVFKFYSLSIIKYVSISRMILIIDI